MSGAARKPHVAAVIGGVVRQAVCDAGAAGIVLLDDGSPEAALAAEICAAALGEGAVWRMGTAGVSVPEQGLRAHPANKTVLLLATAPREPLLPLGDLYASQVAALAGDWSGPPAVRELAQAAGGIDVLDRALMGLFEERRERDDVLSRLPAAARAAFAAMLAARRFDRRRMGLVPKLSYRTLGIDLFA